eukprot:TRINITY_DN24136_c0_g3_i1.p1 TRINITY_DN24136_c0_g3~~TRINITY_DN24136_c0_g3_i1.p1  ORF type:complete len:823 (+),score=151.35 TRINITY_DN24136_c0_g3_i1:48-2516(+)
MDVLPAVTDVDVEAEAARREEALTVLRGVLPGATDAALDHALSAAGGSVEVALNRLLGPDSSRGNLSTSSAVAEPSCSVDLTSHTSVDPSSIQVEVPDCEMDDVAQLPTPSRAPLAPDEDMAQRLQQVLPHCDTASLRLALSETHNDLNAATERLLGGGGASARLAGHTQASSSHVGSVEECVEVIEPLLTTSTTVDLVGKFVEVGYPGCWYWASVIARNGDGTFRVRRGHEDSSSEDVAGEFIRTYPVGTRVQAKYDDLWYWAVVESTDDTNWAFHVRYEEDDTVEDVPHSRIKSRGWMEQEASLQRILPDCDSAHLCNSLEEVNWDENAALERILSKGSYPKRVVQRQGVREASSTEATGSSSSSSAPADQSSIGDRGEEYWFEPAMRNDERRPKAYREEAKQLLMDEFRELRQPGIIKVLERCDYMYAVAWKLCYEAVGELLLQHPLKPPLAKLQCPRKKTRNVEQLETKSIRPPSLRKEFEFVRWWRQRGVLQEERRLQQEAYRAQCEVNGLLLECECCFAEHLPEQTVQCAAGHLFCMDCAKRYVETMLNGEQGMPKLVCMSTTGCREQLPRSELVRVLPAAVIQSFDQRLEKAAIEAAMLKGSLNMEKCPFCDFVMEMDLSPEENRIFVCLAPNCGKESCRLCKEENHIPLRCDEVEKKEQAGHRVAVEESMSNALIRECPSCKEKGVASRFVKTDGCNKMTCPKCKGWVCYECNQMIPKNVGYGHFCQHPLSPGKPCKKCTKCRLWSGTDAQFAEAEEQRVRRAGLATDGAYRSEHSSEALQERLAVLEEGSGADGEGKEDEEDDGPPRRRRRVR